MRSRSRYKDNRYTKFFVKTVYSNGDITMSDLGHPLSATLDREIMHDTVGNPFPGMNPCYHTKVHGTNAGPQNLHKLDPWPGEDHARFVLSVEYPGTITTLEDYSGGEPSASDLNEFLWDSAIKCSTQVPESVSIANFLWEIREEILKIAEDFWKYMSRWLTPGGAYLGAHFGVKQFLADCKKILKILKTARARLKYLRDTYGKAVPQKFRQHLEPEEFPRLEPPFDYFDGADTGRYTVSTHLVRRQFTLHATWLTCHRFPGLDSAMALLDVMGASLGLQNPIKVIWNAIPFSWLLDYFVSTGSFFDRLQLPSFSGEFQVLNCCWGFKCVETYQCWLVTYTGPFSDPTFVDVGDFQVEHYRRRQGMPLGSIFTRKDSLSAHQWRIILALIGGIGRYNFETGAFDPPPGSRRKRRGRNLPLLP